MRLLTLHRPSNVDDRETFLSILEGLGRTVEFLSDSVLCSSAHPKANHGIRLGALLPVDREHEARQWTSGHPLARPSRLSRFSLPDETRRLVVTDSGGIQEETTCLGVPCVTVRENTERPVTVTCGTNVIAGTNSENIRRAVKEQMSGRKHGRVPEKWDGHAAGRIVVTILRESEDRNSASHRLAGPSAATIAR